MARPLGSRLQIGDDEGGVLVGDVLSCADAVVELLSDDDLRRRKGLAGHERYGREFLMPRLARDELALYGAVLEDSSP